PGGARVSARPETGGTTGSLRSAGGGALRVLSVHGLLLITFVVIAIFSFERPGDFPTLLNFQSVGNIRAPYALLALAVMIPLAANEFDLSVGFLAELSCILAVGLQVKSGLSWQLACLVVIVLGALVGLINGVLVTKFRVSSFIATLGVGTFIVGVSGWYSKGELVFFGGARSSGSASQLGVSAGPQGFFNLTGNALGIPVALLITIGLGIVLWLALEYLAVGRYLYVIGANPRAAGLSGISVDRLKILSFVASGTITGVAGCLLGSQLQVGQLGLNQSLLLPAFAGALLGATAVRPGRVNVWGTLIATALLGITVSGLQMVGAAPYFEQLFNGAILIVAVALSEFAALRREAVSAHREREELSEVAEPEPEVVSVTSSRAPGGTAT
ncbi:MAG: ABC transporter permease, partial [Gaiellaceae bacterium]